MQRAVGMSISSLYRTFLWEGAYYGIISSVIGAAAGYICTVLIESGENGICRAARICFSSDGTGGAAGHSSLSSRYLHTPSAGIPHVCGRDCGKCGINGKRRLKVIRM